jgi:HD domain
MPQLDQQLAAFDLRTAGGAVTRLDALATHGPLVLAMIENDVSPDPRMAMLRELGRGAAENGARLVVVSPGDCAAGRQLDAAGIATWATDAGDAFAGLGLTERKRGRTRRHPGVFVVDRALVLRFAFVAQIADQWIPASFVLSRLARLVAANATKLPDYQPPDSVVEAEMDALVRAVGSKLGLTSTELTELTTASRFRDLGMTTVPDEIITKDGPLNDDEWAVIKQHPERSAEMLGASPVFETVREVVRASHEHMDGSGYPRGIAGDSIPTGARVLLAVESYLAMTQERPYREMLGMRDAISEMQAYAGRMYDAGVVAALVEVVAETGAERHTIAA